MRTAEVELKLSWKVPSSETSMVMTIKEDTEQASQRILDRETPDQLNRRKERIMELLPRISASVPSLTMTSVHVRGPFLATPTLPITEKSVSRRMTPSTTLHHGVSAPNLFLFHLSSISIPSLFNNHRPFERGGHKESPELLENCLPLGLCRLSLHIISSWRHRPRTSTSMLKPSPEFAGKCWRTSSVKLFL